MSDFSIVAQALYGRTPTSPEKTAPSQPKYDVSFFMGSKLCGGTKWPDQWSHEQRHVPYSVAYFCPRCGDIWARIHVHQNSEAWSVWTRHCRRHVTRFSIIDAGTFCQYPGIIEENFDIPTAVLAEDFLFLMKLFDEYPGSYEL